MTERADVLVIGAGASGSVVSKHLAEAGFGVVCLEQGGWVDASDFPGESLEWELATTKRWHLNPNVRALDADYPCETSESDVNPLMHNAVGGSTIHYGAQWMRFPPSDFRMWTLDGLAEDWPISYEDLAPHYDVVQGEMGVSGLPGDPAYPPHDLPMPALSIGKVGRIAAEGMNRLGWHWWPGTQAMPSRDWGRQKPCARRGTCMWGCVEGAKGTMDITHWPDALAAGAKLVTGARVREITERSGLATGALYVDRDGREHRQEADVVILAANGVGTPRLLLLSASARFPDGLANSSGLVGRRLMMHPFATVLGIYEQELESWLGPLGNPLYSLEFYETDWDRGFPRGAKWELLPLGSPLGLLGRYPARRADGSSGARDRTARPRPGVRVGSHGRRSSGRGEPRHARSRADRLGRAGSSEDQLPDLRHDASDARLAHPARDRGSRGVGCRRDRRDRMDARHRLASPRHLPDGRRPGVLSRGPLVPLPRHSEPLRRRRQRLRHRQRHEPDGDDLRRGAPLRHAADRDPAASGGAGVTPEQRAVLAALADALLPAADGMPAASEVDVPGKWMDRALRARPDLEPELLRVLDGGSEPDPETRLAQLRGDDPAALETLVLLVTGAYYMHPKVRKLIGYPGQKATPEYPDEAEYYLSDGLLDPVLARGSIYRPTPLSAGP